MSLRVGVLGTGGIAVRHATALAQVEGLELVASASRSFAGAEAFAAKFGGRAHADFDHMLGDAELDLLIVALPPGAHAGEVEKAASAGVNLLVEKPIALDLGRGEAMVSASRGVVAACGFMYRFGDAVAQWDALRASGKVGRTGHFAGSFHCNALHAPWWRERAQSGGQMVEQLIHIVDLARENLGMPQTIYARAANLFHRTVEGYDGEDMSAVIFGYDDGRMAVLHASNAAVPGRWMKSWQVVAERATGLFTDWNNAELVMTEGEVKSVRIAGTTDPFVAQLTDLRDAITEQRPPRVPLSDGLATLRMVLAARRSADLGREVML
ncbi:MAG TPA: Gfo/Idh/MocA family oxidoreductase [Devosia sp.]